jgi:drug/metabolite transporter (DMT)-like permease
VTGQVAAPDAPGASKSSFEAPALMVAATFLFSVMGAGVKWASAWYSAAEIVMYRGLIGALVIAAVCRWQQTPLRTPVPGMHVWRSVTGVVALGLWFHSFQGLPLGTAVTLNYMSSVWMALFVLGGAALGAQAHGVDGRLVATVLVGFVGVGLVLQPTLSAQQLWFGLAGLLSGVLAAMAYLQVAALGRVGEPETRVVFYFSLAGVVGGAAVTLATGGFTTHHLKGLGALLGIGVLATTAQLAMTHAYAVGSALTNGALAYLGVAFSFVLGVWLFDDPVTRSALLGMMLIAAAGITATALRQRLPTVRGAAEGS